MTAQQDYFEKIRRGEKTTVGWQSIPGKLGERDTAALADAMCANGNIRQISLANTLMGSKAIHELARGIAGNPKLETLQLGRCMITDEGATALADALRNQTHLQEVDFNHCGMSDDAVAVLADALSTCPELRIIDLQSNRVEQNAADSLGAMLKALPRLEQFSLASSNLSHEHFAPIADAIPHCHALVEFDAGAGKGMTQHGSDMLGNAFRKHQGAPNLISCHPSGIFVGDIMKANRQRALKANEAIENCGGDFASLRATEIGVAADLLPAIRKSTGAMRSSNKAPHLQKFSDYLGSLPTLDTSQPITADKLLAKDNSGRCALDNPHQWQRFRTVLAQTDASVTLECLQQPNRDGDSFLTVGLMTAPQEVIHALHENGMQLTDRDLLQGYPESGALQAIIARDAVQDLFTLENWKGQPPENMQRVYHALPDNQRALVNNYHSLFTVLGAQQAQISSGRGR